MATSSLSRAFFRSVQVTEDFRLGSGPAPNSQGDLLVGNGAGGFVVNALSPSAPAASVLVAGPAAAPPSTRVTWAPLILEDAAGASPSAASLVSGVSAASGGLAALGVRKVVGGTGIAATTSGADVLLDADFTVGSAGGGLPLVAVSSTPGAPVLRTLVAGTGVALAETGDLITVSTTYGGGTATTLASAGGTESLVNDGAGPALATKGLTAGTGIYLESDAGAVTVSSIAGIGAFLASTGTGESLVNDGVGPDLATKGLAGTNNVTVTSTTTIATVAGNVNVVSSGSGDTIRSNQPNQPRLRTLAAGFGITISEAGNLITVSQLQSNPLGWYPPPRYGVRYISGPATSLAVGSALGTMTVTDTAYTRVAALFNASYTDTYTLGANGGITIADGGFRRLYFFFFHITFRIDGISEGLAALLYTNNGASPVFLRSISSKSSGGIATLQFATYYNELLVNGDVDLRVQALGSGVTDTVEIYSAAFGIMRVSLAY